MITSILISVAAAATIGIPGLCIMWGKAQERLKAQETTIGELRAEVKDMKDDNDEIRVYVSAEVRNMNDLGWKRELESTKKLNEVSERIIKIESDTSYIKTMLDKIYDGRCQA